jgi:hypothetical protein
LGRVALGTLAHGQQRFSNIAGRHSNS